MQSVRLLIPIEYAVMYSKNTFSASCYLCEVVQGAAVGLENAVCVVALILSTKAVGTGF